MGPFVIPLILAAVYTVGPRAFEYGYRWLTGEIDEAEFQQQMQSHIAQVEREARASIAGQNAADRKSTEDLLLRTALLRDQLQIGPYALSEAISPKTPAAGSTGLTDVAQAPTQMSALDQLAGALGENPLALQSAMTPNGGPRSLFDAAAMLGDVNATPMTGMAPPAVGAIPSGMVPPA